MKDIEARLLLPGKISIQSSLFPTLIPCLLLPTLPLSILKYIDVTSLLRSRHDAEEGAASAADAAEGGSAENAEAVDAEFEEVSEEAAAEEAAAEEKEEEKEEK